MRNATRFKTKQVLFGAFSILCIALLITRQTSAEESQADLAKKIISESGVTGGLIVHFGCGDGKLTAQLKVNDSFQVHGLDKNRDHVETARKHIRSLGMYGEVSVEHFSGNRLGYVDNLINLFVAEDLGNVSMQEVMRVLAPGGVAYLKQGKSWKKTIKRRSAEIDEWTHYLHDASGNSVAHDQVVGPPRHLQWIGSPRWSRHHDRMASMSALVSASGRIFYIMDEGSRTSIQLPAKWKVVARDAFNGIVLWKRDIDSWHNHLWPLKNGPTQLARRLVAVDDKVFVTLDIKAPLRALDAVTGKTLLTYENSDSTEEIIYSQGKLFLVVNKGENVLSKFTPENNVGDQQRVRKPDYQWNQQPRQIMAFDADSGKQLWVKETRIAPITLAATKREVLYYDGKQIVCLDRNDGSEIWKATASRRSKITMNFGPRLVIYEDVVLFAGGDRKMHSFSLETGEELWNAYHDKSAYDSPEDLLITGGLVWSAPTTATGDSGVFTGRDPKTGEVKSTFPPNVKTYWFHHRCYMAKATDRFLLPSRTGIEFVDYQKKDWNINHWVRGGCLYGIMPCNGLVYTPPHNCACYPEAKLYGLNALAAESDSLKLPQKISEEGRLETGPAFEAMNTRQVANSEKENWPAFRHDSARSGAADTDVPADLKQTWKNKLGGKLSALTIAEGKLFVAQVDKHTLFALDADSGEVLWNYTVGGRIDSPPTYFERRVIFGSADGWVYCLRAQDGVLIWRFRAAPMERKLMAFEQIESVWPVHGSILVQQGKAYFVAGRSNFLDGGLRWFKLDARTGQKLTEVVIDERDPETKENIQARLQILNMPVGLPDILSSDGKNIFMRSQRFDQQGNRFNLGPHSGDSVVQGATQEGEGRHLFAPMGFLDDTWFHRSYWVYGLSFAGGHSGYHQAGKYTQAGRILVHDDEKIYGFARKSQYYRWTTTMEHQLFAATKQAPKIDPKLLRRGKAKPTSQVAVKKTEILDPTGKPLTVEAWVKAAKPNGTVIARGANVNGYAIVIKNGIPGFLVRSKDELFAVYAKEKLGKKWTHLAGCLTPDKKLKLYVNGKQVAEAQAERLIAAEPLQSMEIGADAGSAVGNYRSPFAFTGLIDEVRIYHRALSEDEIRTHYEKPSLPIKPEDDLVYACSFENGTADASGNKNQGKITAAKTVAGKFGQAMKFTGGNTGRTSGSYRVEHLWEKDVPLFVRAMLLSGEKLFIAGPPDLMDEEKTFKQIVGKDRSVDKQLIAQDAALRGEQGAILQVVSTSDGNQLASYRLKSIPTWDSFSAAHKKLYFSTVDGEVICYGKK